MITAAKRRAKQPVRNPEMVVAYLRVSTEDQRNGLEAQRSAIESWAAHSSVTVIAWCADEGVSGAAPLDERPALLEALASLRDHNAGQLVAAKRDRLARDVSSAAAIERLANEAGARVVTADGLDCSDTPEGALLRTLIDAMAQYERALIRARTKAALRAKLARGERVGAPVFGFDRDGKPVELEQRALQRMRELRGGGATQAEIAATLTAEGFSSRRGRWHVTSVARALARH